MLAPSACPPTTAPCLPPPPAAAAVGNFSSAEAVGLLSALRAAAGERCQLLLCTDLWKDPDTLRAAYDDSQGRASKGAPGLWTALGTPLHC